ncbi:MAG: phosphoribosylformylglycinamidine synthase subunit PurQ [Planctomycetes bacterium]|nr:phosphoribosylformylglycinamidine synthase subunit PurQ [Planctomycetota bacterium]
MSPAAAPEPRTRPAEAGPRPRAVVLRAAGSNCDLETAAALDLAGAEVHRVHINRLLGAAGDPLDGVDLLAIPGGFTYGDDLGAGRILGLKLERHLADAVRRLVDRGGLVVGVCNGFQALVRAGLLPGGGVAATLAPNASGRFEARWVRLRIETDRSPWLRKGDVWDVPSAHGEGRLVLADEGALAALEARGQVAARYLEPSDGAPGVEGTTGTSPARYPANPSGSTGDVAGLVDETGRILGLMPHPERNIEPWHRPGWTRRRGQGASGPSVGRRPFEDALAYLRRRAGG